MGQTLSEPVVDKVSSASRAFAQGPIGSLINAFAVPSTRPPTKMIPSCTAFPRCRDGESVECCVGARLQRTTLTHTFPAGMEDAHATVLNLDEKTGDEKASFFAVYDGHGGEGQTCVLASHAFSYVLLSPRIDCCQIYRRDPALSTGCQRGIQVGRL